MLIDKVALTLAIIGALNWGGIGLFGFDTVAFLFGGQMALLSRVVYALVLRSPIPIDCLKLVTAIVVALAIAAPTLKSWAAFQAKKRKALAARKGER